MNDIEWPKIKGVIFDLDGTLYDQRHMRVRMIFEMIKFYAFRVWLWKDLLIIYKFRELREKNSFKVYDEINTKQYSDTAFVTGSKVERVEAVIDKWILKTPLKYIRKYKFEGIDLFFKNLKNSGKTIAVFSEYPIVEKLEALNLTADVLVCATDREVNKFKPNTKGLEVAIGKMHLAPNECLYIGDREDKDKKCAESLFMQYLVKTTSKSDKSYTFSHFSELNDRLIESL
ncbi:HAD family hydrolase [Candidatus Dependentiae bacterium]|nr:HAD family hydrolase [Candidatus Dependentiae bacterium]